MSRSATTGPGNDLVASTVLAAAGCHLILFTTGRGTPFGCVVPTLKIASNATLAKNKPNWIDWDAMTCPDEEACRAPVEPALDLCIQTIGNITTN